MNYNDLVNIKRNTEIGQTLYLKAKDIIEAEDVLLKKSFMNPQQYAIYLARGNTKDEDEAWK